MPNSNPNSTTRLREVSEVELPSTEEIAAKARKNEERETAGLKLILMGLKALSQRTVLALNSLQTLLLAASAFWLWMVTLPNPTTEQLFGLCAYAAFVLLFIVAKR